MLRVFDTGTVYDFHSNTTFAYILYYLMAVWVYKEKVETKKLWKQCQTFLFQVLLPLLDLGSKFIGEYLLFKKISKACGIMILVVHLAIACCFNKLWFTPYDVISQLVLL